MNPVSNLSLDSYTRQSFEPLFKNENAVKSHTKNINKATSCLINSMQSRSYSNSIDLQKILPAIMQSLNLDTSIYCEKDTSPEGFGKFLLSSISTSENKSLCLQLFFFLPKQKTFIHNHKCNCALTVLSGWVRNRLYDVSNLKNQKLNKISKEDLGIGSVARVDLSQSNIHSLKNKSPTDCLITAHLYEVDGIHQQSVLNLYKHLPLTSMTLQIKIPEPQKEEVTTKL